MRAAPRPEPVRDAEEVFLVDRVQQRDHRPLDDLVLQGGDRERSLSAVRLRYVDPAAPPPPERPPLEGAGRANLRDCARGSPRSPSPSADPHPVLRPP